MNNQTTNNLCKATWLWVLGLFCLTGLADAGPAESRFAEGNQAYFNADYASAIQCYETIVQHQGVSPGLLHNLALAYQKNGDLGRARLNFERARWLAPRDADIRAELHHLRREFGLSTGEVAPWARPFLMLSLNEWIGLGAAAWAAFGGLILARGLGVKRLPFKTCLAVSGTLLAMSLGGMGIRWAQMDQAVVIGDQASLRVSPFTAAVEVAVVSEASPLTVTGSHGAFLKVRTSDGQTGWMDATDVGRIAALERKPPEDGAEAVSAGNRAKAAGNEG